MSQPRITTAFGTRPSHDYHTNSISLKQRSKSANPPQVRPFSGIRGTRPRYVPPFSIQSQQKNTVVINGPIQEPAVTASARGRAPNPKSAWSPKTLLVTDLFIPFAVVVLDLRKQKSISSCNLGASFNASTAPVKNAGRGTLFRMYFDRGDLPIKMEYLCGGDKIGWTVSISIGKVAYHFPIV